MVDLQDSKKEVKEVEKKMTFNDAILEVNSELLKRPNALGISLAKVEGKHSYNWIDLTNEGREVRNAIRRIIKKAWGEGKYNYQQFADSLRVDLMSIQALLDDDMRFRYPHLK